VQIEVAKRDLEAALKIAASAMASGQTTDLQSHYVFRETGGKVQVLTNTHRTFCGAPLTCQVDGTGAFSVEGWRLRQWLQAVGDVSLTFKFVVGGVEASSPRGSMTFPSLDPANYPWFDDNIESAEIVSTLNAARLAQVFGYLQPLILDREGTHAQMSLTEVNEGSLYATNLESMTMIRMSDPTADGDSPLTLGSSELRIHVKDVGSVVGFLKQDSDAKVEILEDKGKCVMFRREDGSVFGTSRPNAGFPKFPKDVSVDAGDNSFFEVSVDEISSGITWLSAGAKRDATSVRFRWVDNDSLVMAMESASGGEIKLPIDAIEHDGLDTGFPSTGFKVPYSYISLLTKHFKADKVRFGIQSKLDEDGAHTGKGYIRFRNEAGGDVYQTLLAWL